jgi:hypothetical protein
VLKSHYAILFVFMQMVDDQDLVFFANFLGVFIYVLVIVYHYDFLVSCLPQLSDFLRSNVVAYDITLRNMRI